MGQEDLVSQPVSLLPVFRYLILFLRVISAEDRRFTFKMGDFIQARTGVARIDQIYVHKFDGERRVFLKCTRITLSDLDHGITDPVLGSGYVRLSIRLEDPTIIIGLPAIGARTFYIVPVNIEGEKGVLGMGSIDSTEYLWIQRSLQWL